MRQETIGDYKGSGSTLLTSNQMRTLGRLDGAAQYGVAVLFPLKVNVGAGVDQHFNDIGSPLPCRHIQGRAPIEAGLWKKLVISGARASGGVHNNNHNINSSTSLKKVDPKYIGTPSDAQRVCAVGNELGHHLGVALGSGQKNRGGAVFAGNRRVCRARTTKGK